jgi:hypothetical protein
MARAAVVEDQPETKVEPEQEQETEVVEDRGDKIDAPEPEPEVVAEKVEEPEVVAEEPAPVKETKTEDIQIPKQRLDAEIARRKQLEETLQRMQQQTKQEEIKAPEYDYESKEKEYLKAMWAGEEDKALEIRTQIRTAEAAQHKFTAEQLAVSSTTQAESNVRFNQTVSQITSENPVYNPESDTYNKTVTDYTLGLRDKFMAAGDDPSMALQEAYTITKAQYPELFAPASTLASSTPPPAVKNTDIKQKVAAANKQPPALGGDGGTSRGETVLDLDALSQEEFDALPAATLQRLRGDIM